MLYRHQSITTGGYVVETRTLPDICGRDALLCSFNESRQRRPSGSPDRMARDQTHSWISCCRDWKVRAGLWVQPGSRIFRTDVSWPHYQQVTILYRHFRHIIACPPGQVFGASGIGTCWYTGLRLSGPSPRRTDRLLISCIRVPLPCRQRWTRERGGTAGPRSRSRLTDIFEASAQNPGFIWRGLQTEPVVVKLFLQPPDFGKRAAIYLLALAYTIRTTYCSGCLGNP